MALFRILMFILTCAGGFMIGRFMAIPLIDRLGPWLGALISASSVILFAVAITAIRFAIERRFFRQ